MRNPGPSQIISVVTLFAVYTLPPSATLFRRDRTQNRVCVVPGPSCCGSQLRRVRIVAVPSSGPPEVRQSVPGDILSSKPSPGYDGGGGGGDHHGDTGTDALVIIRQPPLSKTATGQGKWSWTADLK